MKLFFFVFTLTAALTPPLANAGARASVLTTELPYQCSAWERRPHAPNFLGKRSSRLDWAKNSALEACRASAREPRRCQIFDCSGTTEPSPVEPSPVDPSPAPQPGQCVNSTDCGGFEVCVENRCVSRDGFENRCHSSFDCGWPTQCINGKCLGSGDPQCNSNSDCSGFQICVSQKCVDGNGFDNRCNSNFDCPTFYTCNNGSCTQ